MRLFSKIAVTLVVITLVSLILLVARLRKDLDDNEPFVVSTTKICQLTGVEDRERPERQKFSTRESFSGKFSEIR
jgi:hypothetical protein